MIGVVVVANLALILRMIGSSWYPFPRMHVPKWSPGNRRALQVAIVTVDGDGSLTSNVAPFRFRLDLRMLQSPCICLKQNVAPHRAGWK